ncbi:SAF domain-containing protein [Demequina sp. NBRC 110052]|uniref:SAF domain-containing protein n=1 Tax=Demequina sp. NBRC 110052 TaxID=1570341 RepID=UPI0013563BB5|nr:SAF domain-containing protein [Demequina sp. NBRC 110052]
MTTQASPVAGRLTRPSWRDPRLLIGLVLIALSVAAVASIVRGADRTEPFYAARGPLPAGTVLDESDVVVVQVRVADGVYAAPAAPPWGRVLSRSVGEGELVPMAALVAPEAFDGRPVAVTTARPLAEGIGRGAIVDVWLTVEGADGAPTSTLVGESLVVDAVQTSSGAFTATGSETVYVVVPEAEMEGFLDALATEGELSVVGLAG